MTDKKCIEITAAGVGRDPQTAEEWQEAVESADFLLMLDSFRNQLEVSEYCRQYGLVNEAGRIDSLRCAGLLVEGRRRGIVASAERGERVRNGAAGESVGWPF